MQKAMIAWGLGISVCPTCKGQTVLSRQEAISPDTLGWEATCSLFSPLVSPLFPQSSLCQWSLWRKKAWGLVVSAGGGCAGRKEGYVWSGVSLPLTEGSSCTWKPANLKYKWDPLGSQNSSPHSCTASIYSTASLQPKAASETALLRSVSTHTKLNVIWEQKHS